VNNSNNEEKIEAGKNTAHVAGKAVATKLGGRLGGAAYDKVASTRLGQRLERGVGKNIANSPVGNINKKLNDSGVVDNNNAKNFSNNALAKNKANRGNVFSFLNQRRKNNGIGLDNNEDNSNGYEDSNVLDNVVSKAMKIKKYAIIIGPAVFVILIIVLIISIVGYFGSLFGIVADNGSSNNSMITQNVNEAKYYDKLNEVVASYEKSCGIVIDKNYIHTILIYKANNYDEFFSQDFDLIETEENVIDYSTLAGKVDTVASLMVNSCVVDYEINGTSYNNLITSSFFKDYYRDKLKTMSADILLSDIFYLASSGSTLYQTQVNSNLYVSNDLNVNLVYSAHTEETVNIDTYIKGSMYAYANSYDDSEKLKAYTVAITTNSLRNSGYNSGDKTINLSLEDNSYCDINNGCHIVGSGDNIRLVSGGTNDNSNGNSLYYNDKYYYKIPVSTEIRSKLDNAYNEAFGDVVLVNNGLNDIKIESLANAQGSTYKNILKNTYGSSVTNIKENNYTANVVYNNKVVTVNNVVFYDQNDYSNVQFCGRSGRSIKSSGCGVTAMAIVASTFIDNAYDPVSMMKDAYSWGYCGYGISGTNAGFFRKEASKLKINYAYVSKKGNLNKVTNALSSGKSMVIALMGSGTFTSSGHYIVLTGINGETEEVYVHDPYHKVNVRRRYSGNGWYSFNDVIAKEARGFYILTKG